MSTVYRETPVAVMLLCLIKIREICLNVTARDRYAGTNYRGFISLHNIEGLKPSIELRVLKSESTTLVTFVF
jgi:hypothetical protein